jgi:phage terminase small subunit
MPARKPSTLTTRHDTNAEKDARAAAESALTPKTELSARPPSELWNHKHASALWKELIGLWSETQGKIVTAFDEQLLVKYCLAEEELQELFEMRGQIKELWTSHKAVLANMQPTPETMKDYFNALAQANALLQRFQGMDARLDGKRKLVFSLAQSLYLTPRSRAGVAPPEKEPEEPKDDMEQLLLMNDV